MPTRTPATQSSARKAVAAKAAARKTAPKRPPAGAVERLVTPTVADTFSLRELAARLGKLEVAGLAGKLVQGWRKDLEAIAQANRKSYAGLQAIVRRQTTQIKEAVGELQTVGKVMATVGTKESVRNLDDLALASLQLALTDIRELAVLAANSQRDAFDIVHRRVTENIDEVQRLLHK